MQLFPARHHAGGVTNMAITGLDEIGGADQTSGSSPTIFFSYSRTDQKRALPIVSALEKAGFTVWWDGLLEGGQRFLETTEAALENARAVVVLWTKNSIDSHWVHDEATRGRDRHCLVPLVMDGVMPPLGFRQFQTITLEVHSGKREDPAIAALIRAVAALHPVPSGASADAIAPHTEKEAFKISRRTMLGGTALAAGAGALGAWWSGVIGTPAAEANSLAIMPFDNISNDPSKTYFTDGLTAELRTQLSRNPLLKVAAQTSSNAFRKSDEDARHISRALRVNYLLEGTVQLVADTLRISLELINGETGFSEWSKAYDRPTANVFAVQEEIASAVAAELTKQMVEGHSQEVGGTANLAAYDAYLRGQEQFDSAVNQVDDQAALDNFDAAVAADPDFAIAHAARARSLTVMGNQYDQGQARRARYRSAITAAQRAVELAPDNARTQSALGFALFNGTIDARAAQAPYDKSYALGAGDGDIVSRYGLFSARVGHFDDARRAIAKAVELDPLNPRIFRQQGEVEYSAREYVASLVPLARALELNPDLAVVHSAIGASKLMMGDVVAAKAAYEAEPSSLFRLVGLAIIARKQGDGASADGSMAQMIADNGDNSLYQQAQVLTQWGRLDEAMATLQHARQEGDAGLVYLRNDPFLDPLRMMPDFKRLLAALGFV